MNAPPELTLTGRELALAGFTASIRLYRNNLVLTRLDEDTDIASVAGRAREYADIIIQAAKNKIAGRIV